MELVLTGLAAGPQPGRSVLHDLDLRIAPGEQLAVIGPSGAGKTTLLHVLGLALAPQAGEIRHAGINQWRERAAVRHRARAGVFLAPQAPPLPPRQRVVTAVLAGRLAHMGLLRSLRSLLLPVELGAVSTALQAFDLGDKLFERVDRLSGGERQRVGLARGLVSAASLWLVDEPLSSLDPVRARQAVAVLTTAARAQGATLVASFHQVEVALEQFPRVLGLRDGRVEFDCTPAALAPEDLARLYAAENGVV